MKYLENFTFNIASDNTLAGAMTGYTSVAYFAPFYALILAFKTLLPFLNTQALLYGLNFSLGFYFFTKVLSLFVKKDKYVQYFPIAIIGGLFYVFSPFLDGTIYSHQLLHIYLISVMPACLYYLFKGLNNSNLKDLILSVIIFSVFSTTIGSAPYSVAFVLPLIPIIIVYFFKNTKQNIRNVLLAILVFVLINSYWIFHTAYPFFDKYSDSSNLYMTQDFANDNVRIISGVYNLYSPLNIVFYDMVQGRIETGNAFSLVRTIPFFVIILAGIVIHKTKVKPLNYSLLLISLLISWYLFSPNFGNWGLSVYLWLTQNIPSWGMFRNMYDKFAPSLSFSYALVFSYSLYSIISYINKMRLFVYIFFFLIPLFTIPYTINPYKNDRFGLTRIDGSLNSDYTGVVDFFINLPKSDVSRVVWLPLNYPTYLPIKDQLSGNYYFGPSPLRVLANRDDITGKFSFLTQNDLFLGDEVFEDLKYKNFDNIGNLLKRINVGYVVINKDIPEGQMQEFLFGGETKPLLSEQDEVFYSEILGDKLRDFGNRYSVYKINEKYQSESFSTTGNNLVKHNKITSEEYDIQIENINSDTQLIFLSPYSRYWLLSFIDSTIDINQSVNVDQFKNTWDLSYDLLSKSDSESITKNSDGSISVRLKLYFEPAKYTITMYYLSGISLTLALLYIFTKPKALRK